MSKDTKVVRSLEGTVVSSKGDKTIVVRIDRIERHPLYHKVMRRSSKVHAHDEKNVCNKGDTVLIAESKPISKMKSWVLQEVLQTAVE